MPVDNIILAWLAWLLAIIGSILVVIAGIVYLVLRHKVKADRIRLEAERGGPDNDADGDELAALEAELAAAAEEFDDNYADDEDVDDVAPAQYAAHQEYGAQEPVPAPADDEQDDEQDVTQGDDPGHDELPLDDPRHDELQLGEPGFRSERSSS